MSEPVPVPTVAVVVAGAVAHDALRSTVETLREFGVNAVEFPDASADDLVRAAAEGKGWRAVIVASEDAGLPAALAGATRLPVIRVPWSGDTATGLGLLQDADGNLPAAPGDGEPFATVAIGPAGAKNAALFVVAVLALDDERLRLAWQAFRTAQTDAVLRLPPPTLA